MVSWERIARDVHSSLQHPLLGIDFSLPLPFLRLLWLSIRTCPVPPRQSGVVVRAVTWLQIGLDIHDHVVQAVPRASRVLAGDYCSALFYRELVRYGEAEFLQVAARAVCQINEAKAVRDTLDTTTAVIRIQAGLLLPLVRFLCARFAAPAAWEEVARQGMLGIHLARPTARQAALDQAMALPAVVRSELGALLYPKAVR